MSTAGVYLDTLTSNITGCDSIDQVTVSVITSFTAEENYEGCSGDSYQVTVNGVDYNEGNPTGSQTLTALNGCDSVVTINLNFKPLPDDPVISPITLCFGDNTSTELIPTSGTDNSWIENFDQDNVGLVGPCMMDPASSVSYTHLTLPTIYSV